MNEIEALMKQLGELPPGLVSAVGDLVTKIITGQPVGDALARATEEAALLEAASAELSKELG